MNFELTPQTAFWTFESKLLNVTNCSEDNFRTFHWSNEEWLFFLKNFDLDSIKSNLKTENEQSEANFKEEIWNKCDVNWKNKYISYESILKLTDWSILEIELHTMYVENSEVKDNFKEKFQKRFNVMSILKGWFLVKNWICWLWRK